MWLPNRTHVAEVHRKEPSMIISKAQVGICVKRQSFRFWGSKPWRALKVKTAYSSLESAEAPLQWQRSWIRAQICFILWHLQCPQNPTFDLISWLEHLILHKSIFSKMHLIHHDYCSKLQMNLTLNLFITPLRRRHRFLNNRRTCCLGICPPDILDYISQQFQSGWPRSWMMRTVVQKLWRTPD